MTNAVAERKTTLIPMGDVIRGEFILPVPPDKSGADESDIPRIAAATIELCSRLPEVVKYRQASEKAKAIEDRLRQCRETVGELIEKQSRLSEEHSVEDILATGEAIRARQADLEGLQATAEQIAPMVRNLETLARAAVTNASHNELARQRSVLTGAANEAKERAAAMLVPVAAQLDVIAKSPKAVAAVNAQVEAMRAVAASQQLNGATHEIVKRVLTGLKLAG